jgi:hypothetical protein
MILPFSASFSHSFWRPTLYLKADLTFTESIPEKPAETLYDMSKNHEFQRRDFIMFCTGCGQNLPNDANFCLKCGKPQKQGLQSPIQKYETCETGMKEIKVSGFFSRRKYVYIAKAIGPNGAYIAAESSISFTYDVHGQKNQEKSIDELVNKLAKDGWEFVGESNWTLKRFRRIVI